MALSAFLPVLFPCVFVGGFLVLALVLGYARSQRREQAWGQLAARTGLSQEKGRYFFSPLTVAGSYKGYPVRLYTFSRGSGKNRTTYTRLALDVQHPAGALLGLSREGFLSGLGKKLGMQDVRLGDAQFDDSFVIKSRPDDFASRVLSSYDLRQRLVRDLQGTLQLGDGRVYVTRTGTDTDVDRLQNHLELLAGVADALRAGDGFAADEASAAAEKMQWGFGSWDDEAAADVRPATPSAPPHQANRSSTNFVVAGLIAAIAAVVCSLAVVGALVAYLLANAN